MAIVVKRYSSGDLEQCVSVLAEAFVTNPLHRSAFGEGRLDQNRLFFRIGLRHMFRGDAFVARDEEGICGYVHFTYSPHCLPPPEEIPSMAASLLRPLGDSVPKIIQWFARWCRLDPDEPHVHLGPIGVAPEKQGRGIGSALMKCYLERLEHGNFPGYLETDREENVGFYEKFGFTVRRKEVLIGAPTWYMWRPSGAPSGERGENEGGEGGAAP
ncbi:MAG TPA: GNAT family N-acetyltransferase [candidate division Zixibacteria bacterium]|nr:GNAT family N-acetyltransferase [candidate division Zixibacteria bacterium]